jgi:Amt family ammonium transporter
MSVAEQVAALVSEVATLREQLQLTQDQVEQAESEDDTFYLMVCGIFVFLMQAGFALLAAGSIRTKNVKNILLKSVMDASLGGLVWFLVGYGLAYDADDGVDGHSANGFVGAGPSNFALSGLKDWESGRGNVGYLWVSFFFQYAFAAVAATIVSGAVAERCSFVGYLAYCVVIIGFIYPLVTHWVWDPAGFLSASNADAMLGGMLDFAGSGVVHMTGGVAAAVAAAILGPRIGRFDQPDRFHGHSAPLAVLGVFLLWVGWYGFKAGSTLAQHSDGGYYLRDMARAAVTTTLSGCTAACTGLLLKRFLPQSWGGAGPVWDLGHTCNSLLGGLVSVTAGCSVVDPWGAILCGFVGAWVYHGASCLMHRLRMDDPLDAFAVHGACGFWGCLAVGFLATPAYSYAPAQGSRWRLDSDGIDVGPDFGLLYGGRGTLLAAQVASLLILISWVSGCSAALFFGLKKAGIFRVSKEVELAGCDAAKHGGYAYQDISAVDATAPQPNIRKA